MENKVFFYESPQVDVMEIELEQSVLQGSGDTNFDPEDLPWGNN